MSELCCKVVGPPGRTNLGEILETLKLAAEKEWVETPDCIYGVKELFWLVCAETTPVGEYRSPWEDPVRRRRLEKQGLRLQTDEGGGEDEGGL